MIEAPRWRSTADAAAAGEAGADPGRRPQPIDDIGDQALLSESSALGGGVYRFGAPGQSQGYGIAYFSAAGSGVVETGQDAGPAALFQDSRPGYGLYTYVLGTRDVGQDSRNSAYRELVRIIETYVHASDEAGGGPDVQAHTFLIPVRRGRDGAGPMTAGAAGLSGAMRETFALHLRRRGRDELAAYMSVTAGPFLITSLTPSLIPSGRAAPQLVVDLGAVGPGYMYSIIDAYDRPIAADELGTAASLATVRERLLGLFPAPGVTGNGADPAPSGDWVFLLRAGQVAEIDSAALSGAAPTPPIDAKGGRGRGAGGL